jgi:hypothetical protein
MTLFYNSNIRLLYYSPIISKKMLLTFLDYFINNNGISSLAVPDAFEGSSKLW